MLTLLGVAVGMTLLGVAAGLTLLGVAVGVMLPGVGVLVTLPGGAVIGSSTLSKSCSAKNEVNVNCLLLDLDRYLLPGQGDV